MMIFVFGQGLAIQAWAWAKGDKQAMNEFD